MAQKTLKRFKKSLAKIKWRESYPSFVLGVIIVVVLGLLVANYFTKKTQQINTGEQTVQTQQETQAPGEYKVIANDSLSAISEKLYGSQEFWPVLARTNNIVNPNVIFVDSTLKIPQKSEVEQIKSEMSVMNYKVQEGDTLFSISEKVYGDGSKWGLLDKANHVGRLPNGNPLIFTDSTLVIPR